MRKFLFTCCFCALAASAFAAGMYDDVASVSLFGGAAVPASKYNDKNISGDKLAYGGIGPSYGAQAMVFASPFVGIGFEYNGANYLHKTSGINGKDYKTSANRYNLMIAGRYTFAPEASTRFYIPLGAGISTFRAKLENDVTGNLSFRSNKPAFYLGAGIETDLSRFFVLGLEARYNAFWVEKGQFYGDANYMEDINFLLKFGVKF